MLKRTLSFAVTLTVLLSSMLIWSGPVLAGTAHGITATGPGEAYSDFTFAPGFRDEKLDWNIAGNTAGTNPNILSELIWEDIKSIYLSGTGRVYVGGTVYMRGTVDWGLIYDGTNEDSDFDGDNRTMEYSRSNNLADEGSVWDVSGGVNFFLIKPVPSLAFAPMVGFSYHKQNLRITDGVQTLATLGRTPPLGPFDGLDSRYEAQWFGPWAGVDVFWAIGDLSLVGTVEYHYAKYKAEADWNLRSDLAHPVSFEHWAWGQGVEFSVAADYTVMERLSAGATVEGGFWHAEDGTDRIHSASGSFSDTRLNEVNWDRIAVMFAVTYSF